MHATQSDEGFWRGRAEELQHALNWRSWSSRPRVSWPNDWA